jgi:phytoene dehydrogenase-like protein
MWSRTFGSSSLSSVPSAFTTYFFSPAPLKAIFSPSGDHAGDSKPTSKSFVSVALMSLV